MSTDVKKSSLLSATFLIAGWCISNNFLSLSTNTGFSGFFPSLLSNIIALFFLQIPSALLYTEAILALKDGVNIISLCKKIAGPLTAIVITTLFLLLHYSWISYYFLQILPTLSYFLQPLFPFTITSMISGTLFILLLIIIVFSGLSITARINFVLFTALLLTTLWFTFLRINAVSPQFLLRSEWAFAFFGIPFYVGTYYYQSILPTLSTYLQRNYIKIRNAIFWASLTIFLFNILWELLIIGIIPESLLWKSSTGFGNGEVALLLFKDSILLQHILHSLLFFSITTSILINGYILVDVFSDGMQIPVEKRKGIKRFIFCLIIFVPSALLSHFESWALLEEKIVGWGELILIGPLPALLVWRIRYLHKLPAPQLLIGGRATLIAFTLFSILIFYIQGASLIWTSDI